MYKLILKKDGGDTIDERRADTDEELFGIVGRWSFWYFLALDEIDWRDAYVDGKPNCPPDALLAFTCDKANDEPGYSRHGLPNGKLAYGKAWGEFGSGADVSVYVERTDQ